MNRKNRVKKLQTILEPNRIKILKVLKRSNACVCEMVEDLSIKHSLLSHHLSVLSDEGLITNQKFGRHNIYRIHNKREKCVEKILDLVEISNEECN